MIYVSICSSMSEKIFSEKSILATYINLVFFQVINQLRVINNFQLNFNFIIIN